MVILVSGPSCSGKTLIAQKIMETYGVTYYSIDHIKMGMIRGLENCNFSLEDSDASITDKIWPVIKGIIMTAIENAQDIVIEGVYMKPEYLHDFEESYRKHIIPVFICFDPAYIRTSFHNKILKYRNVIEERVYEEDREMSYFVNNHLKLAEDCQRNDLQYFCLTKDFQETIDEIMGFLDRKMSPSSIQNKGINHITFAVSNLKKAIGFYKIIFGDKVVATSEKLAYFDIDGIWFALNVEEDMGGCDQQQTYTHVAFSMDVEAQKRLKNRLDAHCVDYSLGRPRDEREGQSLYIRDEDGHLIEFHSKTLKDRLAYYSDKREDVRVYRR